MTWKDIKGIEKWSDEKLNGFIDALEILKPMPESMEEAIAMDIVYDERRFRKEKADKEKLAEDDDLCQKIEKWKANGYHIEYVDGDIYAWKDEEVILLYSKKAMVA